MAHATTRPAAPPSASATGLSAPPRWERLRDHGHGRRPSPTQTAPRGGRGRDYLVGGGRSASHVPYPDLAGRHRGQAAIGATGVTGAALNSLFYRSRVQPGAVTAEASWLHREGMPVAAAMRPPTAAAPRMRRQGRRRRNPVAARAAAAVARAAAAIDHPQHRSGQGRGRPPPQAWLR
eukprot:COSAG01_NODE_5258_length_4379_cov_23.575467_4_plen_178_part_00